MHLSTKELIFKIITQKHSHLSDLLSAMKSALFTAFGLATGLATACTTPPDAPITCATETYDEDIGVHTPPPSPYLLKHSANHLLVRHYPCRFHAQRRVPPPHLDRPNRQRRQHRQSHPWYPTPLPAPLCPRQCRRHSRTLHPGHKDHNLRHGKPLVRMPSPAQYRIRLRSSGVPSFDRLHRAYEYGGAFGPRCVHIYA